jgi:hypothetical protein
MRMGVWSRYEDVDVQRQPYRRCGPPVFVFDHGPVLPPSPSRAEMRAYQRDYDEWVRGTGGRPYKIALNSVDSREWLQRSRGRYSRSATEREPVQIQPQTTGQVINLVAASGVALGGFWLLDLISGNKYVVFSPDFVDWQARGRGQFVPTTPSA